DRGGEIQRLELEHAKPPAGAAPAPSPKPAPARAHRPPPRVPMLRRPVTRGWVRQQMNNLPQLLTQARVIPHFTDGKADGFVITEIKPGSVFEQIGLQNGDLIKRVNGQTITTPQQAMALYQALDRANAIEVVVERQGQEITLHYDLQ
ncbi:MAG: PDZ domain-containing protein, partial [Zetaproteobacteria bacterium]